MQSKGFNMAQSILKFHQHVRHEVTVDEAVQRKSLSVDKLGVIGGFVVGLLLGVGVVDVQLMALGVTPELSNLAMVVVLIAFTRVGQMLGHAAGDRIERQALQR